MKKWQLILYGLLNSLILKMIFFLLSRSEHLMVWSLVSCLILIITVIILQFNLYYSSLFKPASEMCNENCDAFQCILLDFFMSIIVSKIIFLSPNILNSNHGLFENVDYALINIRWYAWQMLTFDIFNSINRKFIFPNMISLIKIIPI